MVSLPDAYDATTTAQMLSIGRSTFWKRVKEGIYAKPANDGGWPVQRARMLLNDTPQHAQLPLRGLR
jgi:hypothetical protein